MEFHQDMIKSYTNFINVYFKNEVIEILENFLNVEFLYYNYNLVKFCKIEEPSIGDKFITNMILVKSMCFCDKLCVDLLI